KGQIVREIDALGGAMGRAIDATGIQFRMLNRRKGPAMHSPRAQADKKAYQAEVKRIVEEQANLSLRQEVVEDILVERGAGSGALAGLGFRLARFKTGTPRRLNGRMIDYGPMEYQPGDEEPEPFSFLTGRLSVEQLPCYIAYTNGAVHELIRANLHRAPMYSG